MKNPIQEYFANVQPKEFQSKELFTGDKDTDLKTDLLFREITLINILMYNNHLLKKSGLMPIYDKFLENYKRLKYSLDRKSRTEFVMMNKQSSNVDDATALASNISNIVGVKK